MRHTLLALLLTACAAAPQEPLDLTERFHRVAFVDDETGIEHRQLFRWDWPLSVYIEGGTDEDQAFVMQHVATLADITGLDYWRSKNYTAPMKVLFVPDAESPDTCRYDTELTPSAPIPIHTVILIRKSLTAAHRRRCIVQETTQALGLSYDTDGRTDTAFSSGIGTDYLTEDDIALLRILYDPRLEPGMSWAQVEPIVRQIASSQAPLARL